MRPLLWLFCLLCCVSRANAQTDTGQVAFPTGPLSPQQLATALAEDNLETRYQALTQVTPRGMSASDRAELVRLLIPVLDDENEHIRALAAETLGLFGKDARPATAKLISRLSDGELSRTPSTNVAFEGVWVNASRALAAVGPETIDALIGAMPSSSRLEFYGISATFAEMGPAAGKVAAKYVDLLQHGPRDRLRATTYTLSKLGSAAVPAIPSYIHNLRDENFNIQVISCRALAALGPQSKAAAPQLLELLDANMLSTRTHAAMALGAIGPLEGVDLVAKFTSLIQEPNAFSQERGLIALGRLGEHAQAAAPQVLQFMNEAEFSQQPEAALTLWQITGKAGPSLEKLQQLIDNPTYDYRVFAALESMGPDAASLADEIISRAATEDQSLRRTLLNVVAAMGPRTTTQLARLQALLPSSSRDVALAIDAILEASQRDD